jgi:hypothetical protein
MLEDFYHTGKIQRLRAELNPRTRVPEANMLTTRPPNPSRWTSEHRVFAYDSFVKSGKSIIETQRLFRCRFTRPFNVRFFFLWGYMKSRLYEGKPRTLAELKGAIRKQIGTINQELLERVEANFRERLQI